ncbi:MAG: DUF5916 domain-containing protein [Gemmatimonadota bacterium]|nr:DUF5916 domain-containing protein [Gemmatimonadota bacterium]
MRVSTIARLACLLLVASAGPVSAQQPGERPSYERDVPPSLASLARIGEDSARAIALAQIPGGAVEALELVRARGRVLWTFDIKVRGKSDAAEVNVDARTGEIVYLAPDDVTPTLRAGELTGEVRLDGRLDEPAWSTADSIVNLVTIEPEEGGEPAGQTIVKVLASPTELLIGVICHDTNPHGIVSFSEARDDSALVLEDHILLVFDPFRDGRTGYVFAVNPNGARFDGLVTTQGEEVNTNWDAVWQAKAARDEQGWSVEIRIPIKSLSFKPGLDRWGFNVQRRVQRLQETSRWSGINRDYEIFQTSHAGLLTDLPKFEYGAGLSIRPTIVGDASRAEPGATRDYTAKGSLDASQRIGPNLEADLTLNTDFAETEVDARQTNLTRFDLLFPEKRSFFLQGSDIFDFAVGNEADIVPFFSRRIGLQGGGGDLQQVPITAGGKLSGRVGNTNVGALVVRTRGVDTLATDATMGVLRVKQNVLAESSVGMIATAGDPLAAPGSWMGGVDLTYQTSAFRGENNLLVGLWGLRNHRDDLGGASAFGGIVSYPNDLWDVSLAYKRIGTNFEPSLGFVPRFGVQIYQLQAAFLPRPNRRGIRQMIFEFNPSLVTDLGGKWQSYLVELKPLDWELQSGDRFEFNVNPEGDRPAEDFDAFSSDISTVTVPAGSYQWVRYEFQGALADKRRISGEASFGFGGFYGGHLTSFAVTARLKPSALFNLEFGLENNSGELPDGHFDQRLFSGRLQVNVSPDLQVSSLVQYDNESRTLGTNSRLRWTFTPQSDLFVVYNHNLARSTTNRFNFDSDQLLVKLSYALRL